MVYRHYDENLDQNFQDRQKHYGLRRVHGECYSVLCMGCDPLIRSQWLIAIASGLATVADITRAIILIISLRQSRSGMKQYAP